jgi:hypothetical protein
MHDEHVSEGTPADGNPWARISLGLVGAALVAGFVLTVLPIGPLRSATLWVLIIPIAALIIVSGVGWAYVEIRHQELQSRASRMHRGEAPPSDARRILGYLGALVVVAVIAVAGSMVPSRLAPIIWMVYIPIALIGGWWLRTRRNRRPPHNRQGR